MASESVNALVLRAERWGENDCLLTLLTSGGRFTALVKGAYSMRRRQVAATQMFAFCEMVFYERNGMKWVKEAFLIHAFAPLYADVEKMFLAAYICEVAAELSDVDEPADDLLQLTLNTLHFLASGKGQNAEIKAAFEVRAAAVGGFSPHLLDCGRCHAVTSGGVLDVAGGALLCGDCAESLGKSLGDDGEYRGELLSLDAASLAAFRYVTTAPPKRIFFFRLDDETARSHFALAAEHYLLYHLDRGFGSLKNYKKMAKMTPPGNG